MGTVPTDKLERELRKLYLVWLAGLPRHMDDTSAYIDKFKRDSTLLIARLGGQAASLGALADFPVPKLLELSPVAGVVYDQMKQSAIQAGIAAGLQATDIARQMLNAGLDKGFRRLNRLARTETVSAYWKNQWDSVADLPDIVMVWGSETSKRTCDYCLSRDGLVVEDPNIRDHPNGRCTLIPTLRSAVKYKGTLQPDGSVDMDPRWAKQRVAGAKATPSAGPTTPEQRDPLSGKSNPAAPSQAQAAQASAPRPTPPAQQPVTVKTIKMDPNAETDFGKFKEVQQTGIKGGDWRFIEDRAQRATVLLQNDYRAEQAVKKIAANIRNGVDPHDKVVIPGSWGKNYQGKPRELRYTKEAPSFSADDVRDALEDAARWMLEQDTVKPRMLYKGLDIPKGKMGTLQPGATFDVNYSSFSTDDGVAYRYTPASNRVVVRVRNTQATPLKDKDNPSQFGNGAGHKEHLVTGQGRITNVTTERGVTWVDVEF